MNAISTNMRNISALFDRIKLNKLNNITADTEINYKSLINEIIYTISNIFLLSLNISKQFVYKIITKTKEKVKNHNIKLNIRECIYYLYYYKIIGSYSESSIHEYSNGISYDHIFILDAKPRFIILLFLYIGFIKDNIEPNTCLDALNSASLEILGEY